MSGILHILIEKKLFIIIQLKLIIMRVFSYSESCDELRLKPNFRIVILEQLPNSWSNNFVTISQTIKEGRVSNFPGMFKYGFRVKSLK
jgi:hypothetical protein